jgi:predicted O-methyltransferase YrrM
MSLITGLASRTTASFMRAARGVRRRVSAADREFLRVWPHIERIEGLLISPGQEQWLFKTARSLPDKSVIVEIGSFKGRSTCCLAYGCRGTSKHVFAIDTFEGNDKDFKPGEALYGGQAFNDSFLGMFNKNIAENGLTAYVTAIPARSADAAKSWTQPIQMLFIDGSHQYEDVLMDFEAFFPHVVPGGVVAFHDVHDSPKRPISFPGVLKVWQETASPHLVDHGHCATLAFGRRPPK